MEVSSALTRKKDIESSPGFNKEKDHVALIEITDLGLLAKQVSDVVTEMSRMYGKTVEAGIYTHSALDGPIGTVPVTGGDQVDSRDGNVQMNLNGWSKINFNWSGNNDRCLFYGCNSAKDQSGVLETEFSFASLVSIGYNMMGVTVYGQTTTSYPPQSPVKNDPSDQHAAGN